MSKKIKKSEDSEKITKSKAKEISKKIISLEQDETCILASPGHTVAPYFHMSKFNCLEEPV